MAKLAQKMNKKDQSNFDAGFKQAQQLIDQSKLAEAKAICNQLLAMYGQRSEVLNLMGVIHYRGGDPNAAIGYYKQLLDHDPENAEALYNLANLLLNLGYRPQAMEMYESVLIHEPGHFKAMKQLSKMYWEDKRWPETFAASWRALIQESWHDDIWHYINDAIGKTPSQMITEKFKSEMESVLVDPANNPLQATMLAVRAICLTSPLFNNCIHSINAGNFSLVESISLPELQAIVNIPLLHTIMRHHSLPHPSQEKLMTLLRQRLLEAYSRNESLDSYYETLLTLAYQGHVNEYVYYRDATEEGVLDKLRAELESESMRQDKEFIHKLLLFSAYEEPAKLSHIGALHDIIKQRKDKALQEFFKRTINEVLREREIMPSIKTLGSIEDEISHAVRGQYEENPYPRWIDYGDFPQETMEMVLRRLFPWFDMTLIELSSAPDILIAGCGTGKHAVGTAQRFMNSHVMAVDLSRASLSYAIRKSQEYGFQNIDYYQADILKLGELNKQFDIVESAGVLHHMQQPMAGWRIITDLLKPGGIMKIGLYSAPAREDVTAMRQEIKDRGYGDSPDEIRRFRHNLMQDLEMRTHYPFSNSNDFYNLSECRDLLFHRQEHCFTLPQIKECLDILGLTFIGFEISYTSIIHDYLGLFPGDTRWDDLDKWHQLEQEKPDTFFGMYQFWCYKPL